MAFFIEKNAKKDVKGNELENGSDAFEGAGNHCNQCLISGHQQNAVVFCPSCFTFLCQPCTTEHRQQSQDHNLIRDDFELCEEYINLKKQINNTRVQLMQTSTEAEKNINLAELYRDKAFEHIENERKKINRMLDEERLRVNKELNGFETEIKNRITETHTKDSEKFKSIKEETERLNKDILLLNQTFDSLQLTTNDFSETVASCQQQNQALKLKIKKEVSHNEVTRYRFEPTWERNIKKMSIPKLGHILTLDPEKATGNIIYKGDISVHSPSDTEFCNIKGMCILTSKLIVAADQQNNALKILDREQGKLVSTIPMPSGPRDVTNIKDSRIAVTLPTRKEILLMTLSKEGSVTDQTLISVNGACRGIVHNHGHLIVSFHFPTSQIQILDMSGKVIKSYATRHNPECKSFLESFGISSDHKLIYVADEGLDSVTCLTTFGKVKAIYQNPYFSKPRDIAVARNGLVYVTGKGKIHELSSDLSYGRIIMDRSYGINGVQSVLYCEQENALFVGMIAQNVIKKFQLE